VYEACDRCGGCGTATLTLNNLGTVNPKFTTLNPTKKPSRRKPNQKPTVEFDKSIFVCDKVNGCDNESSSLSYFYTSHSYKYISDTADRNMEAIQDDIMFGRRRVLEYTDTEVLET